MKDPQRISDGRDLRAQLLRSAKRDVVPASAKARNVAAVLASAAALHGTEAAAAGAALKAWLVKGAVVSGLALAILGGHHLATRDAPLDRAPSDLRERREIATAPTPLEGTSGSVLAREAPPEEPSARAAPLPSAEPLAAASGVRLAEEVAQLDRARSLLLGGDAGGALVELRRYRHDFPSAQLGREATLLEIDALETSGQHARAQDLARAFIHANPQSPASRRLSGTYE